MLHSITSQMGKGKTLLMSLYALEYSKQYKNNMIYANYSLDLKNFIYTPYLFLPFSKLQNCLLLIDDIYALQNLSSFVSVVVNMSRKMDIHILVSAQRRTMIIPLIRSLGNMYEVEYDKELDILVVKEYQDSINFEEKDIRFFGIKNAVKTVKDIYNTNEIVKFATKTAIKKEILKYSKNKEDLELNVAIFTKSETKSTKLVKELSDFL